MLEEVDGNPHQQQNRYVNSSVEAITKGSHGYPLLDSYYTDFASITSYTSQQLALCLLPCIGLLCLLGGKALLGAVALSLVGSYLAIYFALDEGPLMAVWLSLVLIEWSVLRQVVIMTRHDPANFFLLSLMALFVLLSASWAHLQFRWAQQMLPGLAMVFERMLYGLTPVLSAVLLCWWLSYSFDASAAPYFLMVLLCFTYSQLALPRFSAFRKRPPSLAVHQESLYYILGPVEGFLHTVVLIFWPMIMKIVVSRSVLFSAEHLSDVAILFSVPLLCIRAMWRHRPLWWAFVIDNRMFTLVPLMLLPPAFAHRVILPSYGASLSLTPPLGEILVIISLYLLELALIAHFTGWLRAQRAQNIFLVLLCFSFGFGGIMLSLSWYMYLVVAAGVYSFTKWYFEGSTLDYNIFSVSLAVFTVWFLGTRIGFVSYVFGNTGTSLQTVLVLLVATMLCCTLLIGAVLRKGPPSDLLDFAWVLYSLGFVYVEWILAHGADPSFGHMYPVYLFAFTSGVGILISIKLSRIKVSSPYAMGAGCIWASKLACLASADSMVFPAALFVMWTVAPQGYYFARSQLPSPVLGVILAAGALLAGLFGATPLWNPLLKWALDMDPSVTLSVAFVVFISSLLLMPLALRFYPRNYVLRYVVLSSLMGSTLTFLLADISIPVPAMICLPLIVGCIPFLRSMAAARQLFALAVGLFIAICFHLAALEPLGIYAESAFGHLAFWTSTTCSFVLFAEFLVYIVYSGAPEAKGVITFSFASLCALLPVSYVLALVQWPLVDDVRVAILTTNTGGLLLIALITKVINGQSSTSARRGVIHKKKRAAPAKSTKAISTLPPLAPLGNVATTVGVACAFYLHFYYRGDTTAAVLPLSTLLLLFDTGNEKDKYFAPVLTATMILLLSALGRPLWDYTLHFTWYQVMKNWGLTMLLLPSLVMVISFARNLKKQSGFYWLVVSPLGLISIFFGQVTPEIPLLCICGWVGAVASIFSTHKYHVSDKKGI